MNSIKSSPHLNSPGNTTLITVRFANGKAKGKSMLIYWVHEIMLKNNKKLAQEIQDEIFRKMTADKKIQLAFAMSSFCLKLNHLNGRNKSIKTSYSNNSSSR